MKNKVYLYKTLLKKKNQPILNLFTQNNTNKKFVLYNNFVYNTIYYIIKDNNKLKYKEYIGIIVKTKKVNNLTAIKYITLKKYNNVCYTFFMESPLIYNIK